MNDIKEKNNMLDALNTSHKKEVFECIEEPKPLFDNLNLNDKGKYNYDNVIDELVDIREIVALNLFNTINDMNKKLLNGRIKDKEAEKIRIDYLRTYINACNCFNTMVKDMKLKYSKDKIQEFINNDNE